MSKNIRDLILDAINTDDSFVEKNSRNIIKTYINATHLEKEKIDRIFIDLCGFSLSTFLGQHDLSRRVDTSFSKLEIRA